MFLHIQLSPEIRKLILENSVRKLHFRVRPNQLQALTEHIETESKVAHSNSETWKLSNFKR